MTSQWLIVVNATAGRGGSPLERVRNAVDSHALEASIVETSDLGGLDSAIADAAERGIRRFAAVGGDGSAHHMLNAVMRHIPGERATLAIVPAGSGSDFARTFGHKQGDIDGAVGRMAEPDLYPIDVGVVEGSFGRRYFLNGIDVGVVAASAARAESLPRWLGGLRYTAAFWLALWAFRGGSASVDIDRHRFAGNALTVVCANGQFFGGGLNIAPKASTGDGLFDVQVISGPKRVAFSVMPRVIRGAHLTHTAVRRYVGAGVSISVPDHWPVEGDGEILGTGSVTIECLHDALDYLI